MSDEQGSETYTLTDVERIDAALEQLWARGRAKTMLSIPNPATGEIQVVKWRREQ